MLNINNIDGSDFTATYSPEDNKLRLYCDFHLDENLYQRVKSAGFRWAPKQGLFFAHWSPKAEDIALELAGIVGDEYTSLIERSEQRAERFEGYQENRLKDANTAYDAAKELAEGVPFGQPILVGHHSEKKARKLAEKIERGFQKAVSMWNTAQYWQSRAEGVLRHAKYLEKPEVRVRRIKKLEAENRKYRAYYTPNPKVKPIFQRDLRDNDENAPKEEYCWCGQSRGGNWVKTSRLEDIKAHYSRYIAHNENRIAYEKAMLDKQGARDLLKPKARPKQPPLLNYRMPDGCQIENRYHKGQFEHCEQYEMTKAQYSKIHNDYKGTGKLKGHRVRMAMNSCIEGATGPSYGMSCIFLTDSKEHTKPK